MLYTGLVSVTFRPLSRENIACFAEEAGLDGIEWGGDIHVPPADPTAAEEAAALSAAHHQMVFSYGSYDRCTDEETFPSVLQTALRLGAPHIRVWAGETGSAEASPAQRNTVIRCLRAACRAAQVHGITVSTECHPNTLTDTCQSAVQLAEEVGEENFRLYWQPNQFRDEAYNREALRAVLPYLSNVHVFQWDARHRYPLADGEVRWRTYIDLLRTDARPHALLLEFVPGDTTEQGLLEAATLCRWVHA